MRLLRYSCNDECLLCKRFNEINNKYTLLLEKYGPQQATMPDFESFAQLLFSHSGENRNPGST